MRLQTTLGVLLLSGFFTHAATVTLVHTNAVWKYLDDGSNQGTVWRAPDFDDSAWADGIPQFGYGDGDETTPVNFGPDANNKFITTYFRHRFAVTNLSELTDLHIGLVRDDGGVVYINGVEAFRQNMPGTPINYDTLALDLNSAIENNFFTNDVPPGLLLEGENVIAVEIHQDRGNSSDTSFNLRLVGTRSGPNSPPSVSITSPADNSTFGAPGNVIIEANASDPESALNRVDFYADGAKLGDDLSAPYQFNWSPAAGSYALTAVAVDAGGLSATSLVVNVTVTNILGTVTLVSTGSTWKYLDNGSDQGTGWTAIGFNDAGWPSGPAEFGYGDGFEATTNSFGPDPNNKYITYYYRRAFNVADPSAFQDLTMRLLYDDGAVVYLNGVEVWRVNMPGGTIAFNTLANNQSEFGFETNTFAAAGRLVPGVNVVAVEVHQGGLNSSDMSFDLGLTGSASSGGGGSNAAPTVSIDSPASGSTYNAPATVPVQVTANDPDGGVSRVEFYRSGFFVGESMVPPFDFTWNNALVGTFQLTAVAVDSNNGRGTSAPVSITFTSAAPNTLIGFGSSWKYLDDGSDQGTAWRALSFDDSSWSNGVAQLGFGDGDENPNGVMRRVRSDNSTIITFYFRHVFTVSDPSAYSFLLVRLRRDDGGIVYLNDTEVFRSNIGGGAVNYLTLANLANDDGNSIFTNTVASTLLNPGLNVIAVEIHQNAVNSSDVTFDLELIGNTGAIINNPPSVALTSPSNDSTYTEPANVNLTAAASDSDGQVTRVEFFANGGKIGEDNAAPYNFVWGGVSVGTYNFTAVALDNLGTYSTSAVVRVFVTPSTAPTIAGRTPAPGTVNALTQVQVQFSEPVDGVSASDLLLNGVAAASVSGSNALYTFTFGQPLEGPIRVEFASNHGIVDRESPPKPFDHTAPEATWQYNLVDNVAPTVVLTEPAASATLAALTEIQITFSEPVANVNAGDLLIDGVPATDLNGFGAGPYRFGFLQPAAGTVQVAWANGHGIRDFASAQNPFAGGSWTYFLDPNTPTNVVINEIMFNPVPSSTATEYIELYNRGATTVNLTGWRISRGVDFTFPSVTVAPGAYLVVAANVAAFNAKYPGVANVIGGWRNILSNEREEIQLEDANGNNIDTVEYADEGDWALRARNGTPTTGWMWVAEADGLGKSLELCNPNMPGNNGLNWRPSVPDNGTPGVRNSHNTNNIAPLILNATHSPAVPRSTDNIYVTAEISDEQIAGTSVTLRHRDHSTTSPPTFSATPMLDDGAHGDGAPDDGIYGAVLSPQPVGTILEYYIEAVDAGGRTRTWPAGVRQSDSSLAQTCNALIEVSDEVYTGSQPLLRLVTTATEHEYIVTLGRNRDREFNLTLIAVEGGEIAIRHNLGMRYRGASSFNANPPTVRINIPKDRPWKGASEYNLNSVLTYNQVTGAALSEKAGLPAAHVRATQLRVNGVNWGLPNAYFSFDETRTYGSYALQEVMNDDWAERVFPDDASGNVYRCARPDTGLDYLGTNPGSYLNAGYSKESNTSENDWSDLINLTFVLNNSPDATYIRDTLQVVNVNKWMLYFAACQLMQYRETALCNGANGQGVGDDYSMYRGVDDPRFILMPHDFDSIFGRGDQGNYGANNVIFDMNAINTVGRFMSHPEITPAYYRALKHLADTVFEPSQFDPFLDRLLGEYVPTTTLDAMKAFNVQRRNLVLAQIPLNLTVNVGLPTVNGFFQTTSPTLNLTGGANVIETYSVKVNGTFASWIPLQRSWNISGLPLNPGLNTVTIQTFDQNSAELERSAVVIWYDDGNTQGVSGTLAANTTWAASAGPFVVSGNLTVPTGVTLTIEPGTTIYFAQGASITVNGRLLAEGTESERIRFTRQPGSANTWGGIRFSNTTFDNRITYADIDFASTADPITAVNSTILVDNVVFSGTTRTIIDLNNSSALIRNSVFPTIADNETVHGTGMPANGYVIIEGNYFGGTTGYSDIIDFTGGQRPGPILQVLNNTFDGGSDDALDLDGTDAHIEGNLFMNIHQDAARDSSGNAIATDTGAEVTIVRNVFINNDHMLLLKNGASAVVQNNTVVGIATNASSSELAGVINFNESRPGVTNGAGAVLEGNIFWNVDANRHFVNVGPGVTITVNHSLLAGTNHPGTGNISADPLFVGATDPRLRPGSPAIGTGPLGLDMGAYVPEGVAITGEPVSPTGLTSATLNLYGPGITHYWYSLDGGPYGVQTPITTPISLSGLSNGPHFVSVIGKDSAGVSNAPVRSRIWVVRSGFPAVIINEVLARGDQIELYNPSGSGVSLAGWGLTDEADNPFKFRFGLGTSIGAGQYLVLNDAQLGFALKAEGDEVYLTDPTGRLVDSVVFGLQIDNYSIGRLANRQWALTVPTLAGVNQAARIGNPDTLKINEWLASSATPYEDFIELFNPDPSPVALGGLFLTDSIAGTLDRHQIAPLSFVAGGGYAMFIADGNEDAGADHVDFRLAAEGGSIGLYHANLALIDCVTYNVQRINISMGRRPNGSANIVFFDTPTPGAPNPALILPGTTVVLNEVLADNVTRAEVDGTTPDWVELFNPTASPINLADMSLSDDLLDPRRFVFTSGTIPAQGYYVIRFEPGESVSPTNTGFGLKASGGTVFLYDKLANGGDMLDSLFYGVQARDFAVGRVPDGGTNWVLTLPTRRAANIAQALGNPALLRVNEWMADPDSGGDWFEIYNGDPLPVALGNLQLRDNNNISLIPDLSFIGTGLFGFQRFEADGDPNAGPDHVNFSLSRTADSVTIATREGNVIDFYRWFTAQQTGVSEGRLPDGTAAIVKFPVTPSPEESNYLPLTNIVISEILAHSDPPFEDAIELRNLTASAVNISGWYLSDSKSILRKFRVPNGTSISAFGFRVFYETNFNDSGLPAPFSLDSARGDEVYLSQASGTALTGYRDVVTFGATEQAVSVGRYQTSQRADFTILDGTTFGNDDPANVVEFRLGTGRTNAPPKVGPIVISEIMYHPLDDPGGLDNLIYEFIEVRNLSSNDVPLFHIDYPTNTWQFRDGVNFAFPTNVWIPGGGAVLVLSFDPEDDPGALSLFRTQYSLGTGLMLFGPYSGRLDNGGEELALYKPDRPEPPGDPDAGFVPYVVVDRFVYDDVAPWPAGADGTGSSLHRVSLRGYANDPTNWIAAAPSPTASPKGGGSNPDRDGDGMPNDWETTYGFNPDNPADASQDADGDGFTNREEYVAGTNPLAPLIIEVVGNGPVVLRFNATANTTYSILHSPTLAPANWQRLVDIPAGPARTVQQPVNLANPSGFYRLRAPALP